MSDFPSKSSCKKSSAGSTLKLVGVEATTVRTIANRMDASAGAGVKAEAPPDKEHLEKKIERRYKKKDSAEKQAEERLQELSGRLINALEQERRRIARELHDDLNQRLAMLSIELEQLGHHLPRSADELRQRTRELWGRVHDISAEVHRISYQLHPSKLETLGLVAAVRSLCQEISERQVLGVEFSHRRIPGVVDKDVALCVFRVAQEALSNAIKHSGAGKAKVELIGSEQEIELRIADPGAGFSVEDVREKGGLGLVSMQERLRLLGGEFSIESQPGHGTRIMARVALTAPGPLR